MSFDIYGMPLAIGHCEVHPHLWGEYPCGQCLQETLQNERLEEERIVYEDSMYWDHVEDMRQTMVEDMQGIGGDGI